MATRNLKLYHEDHILFLLDRLDLEEQIINGQGFHRLFSFCIEVVLGGWWYVVE